MEEGAAVDYVGHFGREVAAFEAAGYEAVSSEAAPAVLSCPGWVLTDLVLHLGLVHRAVHALSASGCNSRQRQVTGRGSGCEANGGTGSLLAAHHGRRRCQRLYSTGSMPARRNCTSDSARLTQVSGCGPGQQAKVSASGSECRQSRLPSIGGMPSMR